MPVEQDIKNLDGANSVVGFFEKNDDVTKLTRKQLYSLVLKLAKLNAVAHMDAYFKVAFDALARKGEGPRYWLPIVASNLIALAALIISWKCS